MTHNKDFLFRGDLSELDPDVAELIRHETARQARYLILIPSESTVPEAVRDTLSSTFHNIYAEGYPLEDTRTLTQTEILDYNVRLPEYRRLSDQRYYKGTEYADIVEALARRRAAELFSTDTFGPDQLYVNVQPLSGAPANNAVYTALLNPGDTVMGMDLFVGGHLTHGSPVNRSGKYYNIVSYGIHPETERIDYDALLKLAKEHQPKMIIGGFSSYPYSVDWYRFREIADSVGAYLMADIAHVAGLVIADVYPNPIGVADVVTFTTHKTLNGPRGGVIITHRRDLQSKIDRAVFPGEQGGPHINQIAALTVALRLAASGQFRELQQQTVENAIRLAQRLAENGLHIPHGGTDTHMFLVDCKSIVGPDGTTLSGDMAARILDLAGIVLNRQTIPGDTSALNPSGIRIGTSWVTQRGFGAAEIDRLGDIIAGLLHACIPHSLSGPRRPLARTKIDFDTLQQARLAVRDLATRAGIDTRVEADDYPHFYYLEPDTGKVDWHTLSIQGANSTAFLHTVLTSDVQALPPGQQQAAWVLAPDGTAVTRAILEAEPDFSLEPGYLLHVARNAQWVAAWFRSLSDGFVLFDLKDPYAKVPGPVDVRLIGPTDLNRFTVDINTDWRGEFTGYARHKTYFIGNNGKSFEGPEAYSLPEFEWEEPAEDEDLKTTTLHALHQELGAKMVPFAGYDMPVWYTSVMEEHLAVRNGAGVFDVTHMGVFEAQGPAAQDFLNSVTTNDVSRLDIGKSHYTYLLSPDGIPLDDLMIYRLGETHFLLVVNASNNDKNWQWLKSVRSRDVMIDPTHPGRTVEGSERFILRDLRMRSAGDDMRVDVALQGPKSTDVLLAMEGSDDDKALIRNLAWANVTRVILGGFDLIVSRTGYTGERVAYELFVHMNQASALFRTLIENGATPCGLAARDSLRTEAGLPLYGHELGGPLGLNPADAGFSNYVKLYKPFFIGKAAYIAHEMAREAEVVRFRLDDKGSRPPHPDDPIVDRRGRVVGLVTSCSIDSEGYQLGQAYIKQSLTSEGTQLAVFAGSARAKAKAPGDLKFGDRTPVPEPITVLSRFPKRKK